MYKYLLIVFSFILYAMNVEAQRPEIEFQQYELDNGLDVILHKDNSAPVVTIAVMYHVGSKNEDPDRRGFAHFFEHLLFEGSENIERGEFFKHVERAGGQNNANTTFDRTYYYETLPTNQLELGLWLESERMLHAKVDEVGIETQREVVKEERRQRVENQPYGDLLEQVLKRAYKDHPYRWPVIGYMEDLNAATEEDYKKFYDKYYVPNNATLVISGDIDRSDTKELIEKYFATIPGGEMEITRPRPIERDLDGEIRDTVYDEIQLPAVVQAYRIPAMGTEDYYALEMLSTLLSQGQSSRLYKRLVDEEQKAVFVGNFPISMEHPGITLAFAVIAMGSDPTEVESIMDEEIQKVINKPISDKELQKIKNQKEAEFVRSNTRTSSVASNLATYHTLYGDADLINTEIDRYMAVTKEDIKRAADKYYTKDNRVVLYYLPKK